MAEKSLAQKSARGGVNALGGQAAKIAISLISLSILARLISPEEYGLVAMVMAVTAIVDVFRDFGLTPATIQAKTISPQERTNLWWLNTGLGTAVALVVALLAPLVVLIYDDERLFSITLVSSVGFIVSGMTTQYFAQLQREMKFGAIAVNNIISSLIGLGSAIVMALQGFGVWALVLQGNVIILVSLLLFVYQTRWLPGRYRRSVPMKRFMNFGLPLMFSNLINYFSALVDVFLIGRIGGTEVLGYFNRATQAVRTPLNGLRSPLNNVAFSALSRRGGEASDIAQLAVKGQILLAYPLVLLAGGLAAASPALVVLILGGNWSGAAPYFAWVAIAEGLNCLAMTAGWILMVRGKTQQILYLTIVSSAHRILWVLVGALIFGPLGAVMGQAFAVVIQWPLSLLYVQSVTGVSTRGLLANSYKIFGLVLVVSLLNYSLVQWLSLGLLLDVAASVLIQLLLAAACALLPAVRRDYLQIFSVFRSLKS